MHCATASITDCPALHQRSRRQIAVPRINDRTSGVLVLMLLLSLVAADSTMAQTGASPGTRPRPIQASAFEPAPIEEIAAIWTTPVAEPSDSASPFVPRRALPADAKTSGSLCDVATALCLRQRRRPSADRKPLHRRVHTRLFRRCAARGSAGLSRHAAAAMTDDQKRVIVRMGEVWLLPDGRRGSDRARRTERPSQ